jgi:hypothetical protein
MTVVLTSVFVLMLVAVALLLAGVIVWAMLYAAPRLLLMSAVRRLGSHKHAPEVRPDVGERVMDDSTHIG